ncbi:MAG: hypothetical protein N3G75_00700 [Methanothrix sp.]|nr:hypothetical protein [Methanothrix sp.]MCX8206339.1 hypothetical protein [Methanothrix sp.]
MDRVGAVIQDAGIARVSELFSRRPRGLRINETEALVVRARTDDGRIAARMFYLCLKPDGTVDLDTIASGRSRARRRRLASFLRYYGLINREERYNLREAVKGWEGKQVEAMRDCDLIFVP